MRDSVSLPTFTAHPVEESSDLLEISFNDRTVLAVLARDALALTFAVHGWLELLLKHLRLGGFNFSAARILSNYLSYVCS